MTIRIANGQTYARTHTHHNRDFNLFSKYYTPFSCTYYYVAAIIRMLMSENQINLTHYAIQFQHSSELTHSGNGKAFFDGLFELRFLKLFPLAAVAIPT